jgi:hypothetical protein
MQRRAGSVALAGLAAVAAAAVVVALAGDDDATAPARDVPAAAKLPPGGVRGCRERVEGGRYPVERHVATFIGPVTFPASSPNFLAHLRSRNLPDRTEMPPGLREYPMKNLALVKAGLRATLVVPREQRPWMRILYGGRSQSGEYSVTLQACRRSRSASARRRECGWRPRVACAWINTQFNGGVYVDYERAPDLGRCAELIVRSGGRSDRGRLFPNAGCRT